MARTKQPAMRESRTIVGTAWDWTADGGTRYQLLWTPDTGAMRMGVCPAAGTWMHTNCTTADGDVRRFQNVKDARAWAQSFLTTEES